jgi:hypothetical protein
MLIYPLSDLNNVTFGKSVSELVWIIFYIMGSWVVKHHLLFQHNFFVNPIFASPLDLLRQQGGWGLIRSVLTFILPFYGTFVWSIHSSPKIYLWYAAMKTFRTISLEIKTHWPIIFIFFLGGGRILGYWMCKYGSDNPPLTCTSINLLRGGRSTPPRCK